MTRIQQNRPAARPATAQQTVAPPKTQTPAKTPTGWKAGGTASPAKQARALEAHLKSPAGAAQAAKLIETVAKKSELARELNWEAGHIKDVKANADGTFTVDVQLDVLKGRGVQKNFFNAIVNASGKVLTVPQG